MTRRVLGLFAAFALIAVSASGASFAAGATRRESEATALQELADRLMTRERTLDRRDASIEEREADVRQATTDLEARIKTLEGLRSEIDSRLVELSAVEEERLTGLVKMVEGNKPRDIKAWIEALDEDIAVKLLERMTPTKAGKLLAALKPELAARLTARLALPVEET